MRPKFFGFDAPVGGSNCGAGALAPTDVYVGQNSVNLTPLSGSPKQTDDGWRINRGNLQFRAFGDTTISSTVRVTMTGD